MFAASDKQSFFNFENQPKGTNSIPDAEISANFCLLFETKTVPNGINVAQLKNHLQWAKKKNAILVYLTPDQSKPEQLEGKPVVWKSFQDLFDLISELLEDPTMILSERDQFLLRNLQDFFTESGVLPKIDEVVIVAASVAWLDYKKYGLYVCQPRRSFRDVGLIGFYAEGMIQKSIAKINRRVDGFECSDDNLKEDSPMNTKLKRWFADNDWADGKQIQVFDLSEIDGKETISLEKEIPNDLKNEKNRGYAFTQGQRYTLLSELKNATTTSDLR